MREGEDLKTKLRVYWPLLQDIRPETLQRAFHEIAKESVWFPTVAEIRDAADRVRRQVALDDEQRRLERAKDDAIKEQRFLGSGDPEGDVEKRRQEFQQMLADSHLRQIPAGETREISEAKYDQRIKLLRGQREKLLNGAQR